MSVFIAIPKKGNVKECSNYCITALISHASKVMLKILQVRLQQYANQELPDIQAGFRKDKGTRNKLPTSIGSWRKQRKSRKISTSTSLTKLMPLTVWITTNRGKFLRRQEYQTTYLISGLKKKGGSSFSVFSILLFLFAVLFYCLNSHPFLGCVRPLRF